MRISDWSSDVCSSDLPCRGSRGNEQGGGKGNDGKAGHGKSPLFPKDYNVRPPSPATVISARLFRAFLLQGSDLGGAGLYGRRLHAAEARQHLGAQRCQRRPAALRPAGGGDHHRLPEKPVPGLDQHPGALVAERKDHTSELQSLMRISYAVFCLKKKTTIHNN